MENFESFVFEDRNIVTKTQMYLYYSPTNRANGTFVDLHPRDPGHFQPQGQPCPRAVELRSR